MSALAEHQEERASVPDRSSNVRILKEPLTYEARLVRNGRGLRAISNRGDYSYVQDMALGHLRGDQDALERIGRHKREMNVIAQERSQLFVPGASYEYESRASSWLSGQGGYFAPPLWLLEYFATTPSPERILSAMAPHFDLPVGAQSINVPAWLTGGTVGVQAVGGIVPGSDVTDIDVASPVTTIAGNFDVPMQMLEQSPQGAHLDWMAFKNMESNYGAKLEQQLFTGQGAKAPQGSSNDQIMGIFNNSNIPASNQVAYADASPTVAKMVQTSGQGGPVPQAVAAVGNNRKLPPELWLLTTSRAAWMASGEVTFPLALANMEGPGHFALLGYEAIPNDAIPVNLGASGNQDAIVAARPSDWMILESDAHTSVNIEALSGSLMARIQMRRYAAAILLYPSSVAWITGTGLVPQLNF